MKSLPAMMCHLALWKCSIPVDNSLQKALGTVTFDGTHPGLDNLYPTLLVSEHFEPGLSPKTIHILVEVPMLVEDQVGELPEFRSVFSLTFYLMAGSYNSRISRDYSKIQGICQNSG